MVGSVTGTNCPINHDLGFYRYVPTYLDSYRHNTIFPTRCSRSCKAWVRRSRLRAATRRVANGVALWLSMRLPEAKATVLCASHIAIFGFADLIGAVNEQMATRQSPMCMDWTVFGYNYSGISHMRSSLEDEAHWLSSGEDDSMQGDMSEKRHYYCDQSR